MLHKISFALVNDHARYSHFVEEDGTIITVDQLTDIQEARVAIVGTPNPLQLSSIFLLAQMATAENSEVAIEFGRATSPFSPEIIERQLELEIA